MASNVFHLAIPTLNLDEAKAFYIDGLGARLAREYNDRITMDFYGAQIVCHLTTPEFIIDPPTMYPRHFGWTYSDRAQFDKIHEAAKKGGLKFYKETFIRFEGKREEHLTFFLMDSANNLLEFKYYHDAEMMF